MGPESQGQMDTPYPTQDVLRSHSKLLSSRWWSLRVFSSFCKTHNLRTMRASTGDELWRNRLFLLILSRTDSGQTWWLTPSILAFGRQKQMDFCEFRFSLVYDVTSQPASAMHWDSVLKNNNTIKMGWGCTQFNICLTAFPKALSPVPSTGGKKQTKF